jgi:hypothetical protein
MQASYVMIMLGYKTKEMGFMGSSTSSTDPTMKFLAQLAESLAMILNALRNYASAFEAIGGMRGSLLSKDDFRVNCIIADY